MVPPRSSPAPRSVPFWSGSPPLCGAKESPLITLFGLSYVFLLPVRGPAEKESGESGSEVGSLSSALLCM